MVLLAAGVPLTLLIDLAFGPDSQFLLEREPADAERTLADIDVASNTPPESKMTPPYAPGSQRTRLLRRLRPQRAAQHHHHQMTSRDINGPQVVAPMTRASISPDPVRPDLRPE